MGCATQTLCPNAESRLNPTEWLSVWVKETGASGFSSAAKKAPSELCFSVTPPRRTPGPRVHAAYAGGWRGHNGSPQAVGVSWQGGALPLQGSGTRVRMPPFCKSAQGEVLHDGSRKPGLARSEQGGSWRCVTEEGPTF